MVITNGDMGITKRDDFNSESIDKYISEFNSSFRGVNLEKRKNMKFSTDTFFIKNLNEIDAVHCNLHEILILLCDRTNVIVSYNDREQLHKDFKLLKEALDKESNYDR